MTDTEKIWRLAIKDSKHPLYEATWRLFRENFDVKATAKKLEAQKEAVIDYLWQIFYAEELYDLGTFGDGFGPPHAIALLAEWQVKEIIPELIEILESDDGEAMHYEAATKALETFGADVIEPLLEAAKRNKIDAQIVASILSEVGRGNADVYDFCLKTFEKQKDDWDISFAAENLITADMEKAISYLEERLKRYKYSKFVRERLSNYLDDARNGLWPV